MAMPPPPGFKPAEAPAEPGTETHRLTDDETLHILKNELRREHFQDRTVLTFIDSYMRCRNCAEASRDAFISYGRGQSLLRCMDIFNAITKLTAKATMKYGYSAEEVVERVKEVANVDPADIEDPETGAFRTKLSLIPPETRRAIKKFKARNTYFLDPNNQIITDERGNRIVETEIIEVEFWDKMKGTELLGREKDLFVEKKKVEHDVGKNMSTFLLDSAARGAERAVQFRDITPQLNAPVTTNEDENAKLDRDPAEDR